METENAHCTKPLNDSGIKYVAIIGSTFSHFCYLLDTDAVIRLQVLFFSVSIDYEDVEENAMERRGGYQRFVLLVGLLVGS